jgi:hypothetical protein
MTERESDWRRAVWNVLDDWMSRTARLLVVSPDVDGMAAAALVSARFAGRVAGIYTTTHLVLLDGATPADLADALWLDHDISEPGVRCIGHHLIQLSDQNRLPRRHPVSFNPNQFFGQTYRESFRGRSGRARDKYPFGTSHMILRLIGGVSAPRGSRALAVLAHADGSWSTPLDYPVNCGIWQELMYEDDPVISHLCSDYTLHPENLQAHAALVQEVAANGRVRSASSRRQGLGGLPEAWQSLTGRQAINGQAAGNTGVFVQRFHEVMDIIGRGLGVEPDVGETATGVLSGRVETPYPNQVRDLDELMMSEPIFSHAIVDQRKLRYTTDLVLRAQEVHVADH